MCSNNYPKETVQYDEERRKPLLGAHPEKLKDQV